MIEKDLTRIAVALENIAQALIHRNDFLEANFDVLMHRGDAIEDTPAKEGLLPEEIKETPVTHDTIGTGKTIEEPVKTETPELKFEEVSKEFFALLNTIKATKGLEEAKQVATDLIRQYNNGKPISLATLPKESYAPLFEKITQAKAEYEPA